MASKQTVGACLSKYCFVFGWLVDWWWVDFYSSRVWTQRLQIPRQAVYPLKYVSVPSKVLNSKTWLHSLHAFSQPANLLPSLTLSFPHRVSVSHSTIDPVTCPQVWDSGEHHRVHRPIFQSYLQRGDLELQNPDHFLSVGTHSCASVITGLVLWDRTLACSHPCADVPMGSLTFLLWRPVLGS